MIKIGLFILGFILQLLIPSARAELLSLQIEPIVGYERIQQVRPTTHTVNRTIYGARLIAGVLLLSAESEYTHGVIEETFPDLTLKSTGDRIKAGLRSGFRIGRLFSWYFRGGVQATQEQVDQTVDGVTTTTKDTIKYYPYAGGGARAALSSKISATASVVAVIPDVNDMNRNEYQVTAGFAIKLP